MVMRIPASREGTTEGQDREKDNRTEQRERERERLEAMSRRGESARKERTETGRRGQEGEGSFPCASRLNT